MADTRNIVIELKASGSGSETGNSLSNENTKEENQITNLTQLLHPVKTFEKQIIGKNIIVGQAYQYAKNAIKSSATYEINKYFSLTENYSAQQDMDNALTSIGKVVSFTTTVGSGALTGAAAGPAGAIVGAIVATVGWVGNEAIQTYQRFDQQTRSLAGMNVESSFQLTRMGLVDGGRGSYN